MPFHRRYSESRFRTLTEPGARRAEAAPPRRFSAVSPRGSSFRAARAHRRRPPCAEGDTLGSPRPAVRPQWVLGIPGFGKTSAGWCHLWTTACPFSASVTQAHELNSDTPPGCREGLLDKKARVAIDFAQLWTEPVTATGTPSRGLQPAPLRSGRAAVQSSRRSEQCPCHRDWSRCHSLGVSTTSVRRAPIPPCRPQGCGGQPWWGLAGALWVCLPPLSCPVGRVALGDRAALPMVTAAPSQFLLESQGASARPWASMASVRSGPGRPAVPHAL